MQKEETGIPVKHDKVKRLSEIPNPVKKDAEIAAANKPAVNPEAWYLKEGRALSQLIESLDPKLSDMKRAVSTINKLVSAVHVLENKVAEHKSADNTPVTT